MAAEAPSVAPLSAVLDTTPLGFVELLQDVAQDTLQGADAALRNRETFQITRRSVAFVLRHLEAIGKLPTASCSLMVALHRLGHGLQEARELVARYAAENTMQQLLAADKWALQVDHLHTALLAARLGSCGALGHTLALLKDEAPADVADLVRQLVADEEAQRAAEEAALEEWRASPYVYPEAGVDKTGRMQTCRTTVPEALAEDISEAANPILTLTREGRWLEVADHLHDHPEDAGAHGSLYSALHHAVLWEDPFGAALLLRKGADVNFRSLQYHDTLYLPKGSTPLHLAAEIGSEALCRLLVCSGADPDLEDEWGRRPADVDTTAGVKRLLADSTLAERGRYVAERARDLDWGAVLGLIEGLHPVPLDLRASPTSDYYVLHHAARHGTPYFYHLLVANGASPLLRSAKTGLLPSEVLDGQEAYAAVQRSIQAVEEAARLSARRPRPWVPRRTDP